MSECGIRERLEEARDMVVQVRAMIDVSFIALGPGDSAIDKALGLRCGSAAAYLGTIDELVNRAEEQLESAIAQLARGRVAGGAGGEPLQDDGPIEPARTQVGGAPAD